jgi:hypothetical protein
MSALFISAAFVRSSSTRILGLVIGNARVVETTAKKNGGASTSRNWRIRNPEGDDAAYRRIRRRDRREYRRQYWAAHPEAREHHAAYMRQWRARREAACVRDPYRDTEIKFPVLNSYLQVTDVRDANRVFEVKVLSHNELSRVLHA